MAQLAVRVAGATASAGVQAAGIAIGEAASGCFRNLTSGLPHPTECGCIGAVWYYLGCHDHRKFNLLLEIHELDRLPGSGSVFVVAKAGRWSASSQAVKEQKNGWALVEERLFLHVRQADDDVKFFLMRKGVLKSDCIAVLSVKVKDEMIDAKFPKRTWYTMSSTTGGVEPRINMSFYKLDSSVPASQSPIMQQAYLMAQQEADEKGEKFELDLAKMTQKQRLVFLSRVLEGPLERLSSYGLSKGEFYYKAVEVKPDKWEWCYWGSKEACKADQAPQGSIPFLAVSLVLPDRSNRNTFYLRYLDKDHQQHDCFFRRIDRDRNIWSDGLFEFIEKLRNYREMCARTGAAGSEGDGKGTTTKEKKKKKGKKSKREQDDEGGKGEAAAGKNKKQHSRSSSPANKKEIRGRRLLSPSGRSPLISPHARATMMEEVMVSTQPSVETLEEDVEA